MIKCSSSFSGLIFFHIRLGNKMFFNAVSVPPTEEQRKDLAKGRKRAATSHSFFDRRLSGIFRRAHSLKTKWYGNGVKPI